MTLIYSRFARKSSQAAVTRRLRNIPANQHCLNGNTTTNNLIPIQHHIPNQKIVIQPHIFQNTNILNQNLNTTNSSLSSLTRTFSYQSQGHQRRGVFIIAEATPNPESLMFYPKDHDVLGQGAKTKAFGTKYGDEVKSSLLATSLFKVHGVQSIMLASRHVTITKTMDSDWDMLRPNIELVMSQFFAAGLEVIQKDKIEYYNTNVSSNDGSDTGDGSDSPGDNSEPLSSEDLEKGIIDLLEERVQPFVQQDGGDVEFVKYEIDTGFVFLRLMGACSGCPKSSVTLNLQIKQLIIHYYPQVVDVLEWHDPDEEVIPRGH